MSKGRLEETLGRSSPWRRLWMLVTHPSAIFDDRLRSAGDGDGFPLSLSLLRRWSAPLVRAAQWSRLEAAHVTNSFGNRITGGGVISGTNVSSEKNCCFRCCCWWSSFLLGLPSGLEVQVQEIEFQEIRAFYSRAGGLIWV